MEIALATLGISFDPPRKNLEERSKFLSHGEEMSAAVQGVQSEIVLHATFSLLHPIQKISSHLKLEIFAELSAEASIMTLSAEPQSRFQNLEFQKNTPSALAFATTELPLYFESSPVIGGQESSSEADDDGNSPMSYTSLTTIDPSVLTSSASTNANQIHLAETASKRSNLMHENDLSRFTVGEGVIQAGEYSNFAPAIDETSAYHYTPAFKPPLSPDYHTDNLAAGYNPLVRRAAPSVAGDFDKQWMKVSESVLLFEERSLRSEMAPPSHTSRISCLFGQTHTINSSQHTVWSRGYGDNQAAFDFRSQNEDTANKALIATLGKNTKGSQTESAGSEDFNENLIASYNPLERQNLKWAQSAGQKSATSLNWKHLSSTFQEKITSYAVTDAKINIKGTNPPYELELGACTAGNSATHTIAKTEHSIALENADHFGRPNYAISHQFIHEGTPRAIRSSAVDLQDGRDAKHADHSVKPQSIARGTSTDPEYKLGDFTPKTVLQFLNPCGASQGTFVATASKHKIMVARKVNSPAELLPTISLLDISNSSNLLGQFKKNKSQYTDHLKTSPLPSRPPWWKISSMNFEKNPRQNAHLEVAMITKSEAIRVKKIEPQKPTPVETHLSPQALEVPFTEHDKSDSERLHARAIKKRSPPESNNNRAFSLTHDSAEPKLQHSVNLASAGISVISVGSTTFNNVGAPLKDELHNPDEVNFRAVFNESYLPQTSDAPERSIQARPSLLQHLATQPSINSSIEMSPAELGSLRIDVETQGERALVHLVAERPGTADILKRNVETLIAELQDAGFADINLSLGNMSHKGQGEAIERPPQAMPVECPVMGREMPPTHDHTPTQPGQLYLRI